MLSQSRHYFYSPKRKTEAKASSMVNPGKSELQVPHYVHNQHRI